MKLKVCRIYGENSESDSAVVGGRCLWFEGVVTLAVSQEYYGWGYVLSLGYLSMGLCRQLKEEGNGRGERCGGRGERCCGMGGRSCSRCGRSGSLGYQG